MIDWTPDLSALDKPNYLGIADQIGAAIGAGRLANGDRLPPQRTLAKRLGLDFTTVARGYTEAAARGLVVARVGQGTFVAPTARRRCAPMATRPELVDLSMNLPPEPDDPDLLERMQEGLESIGSELVSLLRYQGFGGVPADKDAASVWLGHRALVPNQNRVFVVPGAHPALLAIFGLLARPGDTVLAEDLTYPGARSISAQLGLNLVGVPMDNDGVDADAFAEACRLHAPKLLYLNPTLLNPTTHTIPTARRMAIVDVARRHGVPIVEDDPYGLLPQSGPPAFAALAPDVTWHISGLAKCLGAGLRVAYVVVPDVRAGWSFAAAARTATVMASPITTALATRWITDGTADALLAFVRRESAERQRMCAELLPGMTLRTDPAGFHFWLTLPEPWTRSAFVGHMRATGLGVVASDAFAANGTAPEAVRVCLGGPADRAKIRGALEFMSHALSESPALASTFL